LGVDNLKTNFKENIDKVEEVKSYPCELKDESWKVWHQKGKDRASWEDSWRSWYRKESQDQRLFRMLLGMSINCLASQGWMPLDYPATSFGGWG
jgi:hypothetical protein